MVSKEIRIDLTEYKNPAEAGKEIEALADLAAAAAQDAYAPYSGFHVGAAIELADGQIFRASNQENKAYPSGLCAERTGLFYVQASFPKVAVKRILILAMEKGTLTAEPAFPCGACRQVMVEYQDRHSVPMEVWMVGSNRTLMVKSADDLLPLKFEF